ncbi:hypothetical protein [Nemorincola caseinilytica]|uniref:hypothetical protein n=1 Tax=Nemorincola caseinilytica TaxID=2054315 RepID=UPI0031E93BC3
MRRKDTVSAAYGRREAERRYISDLRSFSLTPALSDGEGDAMSALSRGYYLAKVLCEF